MSSLRIRIVSRIFAPEPSAASIRLEALAEELTLAGHIVEVMTVRPVKPLELSATKYRVRRFPVLRDSAGYVRGYVQYMSFDIPLFFRLLFSRRVDLTVVEPPPTTGIIVRLAGRLKRTPYLYYAADIWADASQQTEAPAWITRIVAKIERWAWRGATVLISVSEGVTERLKQLVPASRVVTVGNGVDVEPFSFKGNREAVQNPTFVYAGTASEWHGADVFVRATALVRQTHPATELVFIGGGSQRQELEELAASLNVSATFLPTQPAHVVARWLRSASASLASLKPGGGYDFAFPTKLYSSAATGAPLLFSGVGPGESFVKQVVGGQPIGVACSEDHQEVANVMRSFLDAPVSEHRRAQVSAWAHEHVSIQRVARNIRDLVERGEFGS